jgi:peptidyl-prolyl cis-trans isomerase D
MELEKVGLVETDFGFHIIKLLINKMESFGYRSTKLEASEATSDRVFTQATKFEMEAVDNTLAKQMKLSVTGPVTVGVMQENFGSLTKNNCKMGI